MKVVNIMLSRDLGGIQQSFLDYSKMLKMEKIDIVDITSTGAQINDYITPNYKLFNLGRWDLFAVRKLKSIISKEKPDIIIAHGTRATIFALKAKSGTNIRLLGITHSEKLKWIEECDHIIALTKIMEQKALEKGIDPTKISLLPNTIDQTIYSKHKKEEYGMPKVIGTMARFVPNKGIDTFLESLAILKKEGIQFKAVIGGTGDEEENLKTLAKDLGLEHYVEFIGWVKDKTEFFNNIDIFCLSSHKEPFGIILLEAMVHKIPIVATNASGPSEILTDKYDALIVDVESAEQMAKSLDTLINDETLANKLATNGLLTVEDRYDIRVVSKILINILNKVIK